MQTVRTVTLRFVIGLLVAHGVIWLMETTIQGLTGADPCDPTIPGCLTIDQTNQYPEFPFEGTEEDFEGQRLGWIAGAFGDIFDLFTFNYATFTDTDSEILSTAVGFFRAIMFFVHLFAVLGIAVSIVSIIRGSR